ncbi:MAG: threonylcarbamoyladenosine tRNA methylthiotransferase MtaB [Patescibacteria group bacterium]|nr:threonylcarbamoyladenosine tRNA methylthiotransferase MtaB [Patescibacteria group bacterium]
MAKINFKLYSLGCKVNHYDGANLQKLLLSAGFDIGLKPNFVVINTCSVTKKAILKDKQLIKKIKKENPGARLVIMGCWPQTAIVGDDIIAGNKAIIWGVGNLNGLVKKLVAEFKPVLKTKDKKNNSSLVLSDRSRYFLKVADGCNQFCSYCIIPHARGRLKSRALGSLLKEAREASKAGYREIVLCGIHLGRYGEDKKTTKINLSNLIEELLKIKDLGRIRLSSIEINEVNSDLIKLIARESRICKHLHISLQSGSTKILRLMNRPYTAAYYKNQVAKIREQIPEIAISTDIIVGFPQESEADFTATYEFAKALNFSKIHVFPFSAHEITAAYHLDGKINKNIINERARILRNLSLKQEKKYQADIKKAYKNKPFNLIVEKSDVPGKIRAKTEFGFDVYLNEREAKKHNFI